LLAVTSDVCTRANESTEYLGPTIGSVSHLLLKPFIQHVMQEDVERQVFVNLSRFIDNPWTVPGHVNCLMDKFQIMNEVGLNLKYPTTRTLAGNTRRKLNARNNYTNMRKIKKLPFPCSFYSAFIVFAVQHLKPSAGRPGPASGKAARSQIQRRVNINITKKG
jgi:hypothetical protein